MAVDEMLLLDAADKGIASVRFYGWSEPTLSLGYFQHYSDRQTHTASCNSAIVRRQTGGGAILHDRELTYSIALPGSHPLARKTEQLYRAVHQAFIGALSPNLAASGSPWKLQLRDECTQQPQQREPFLCFQRKACGDVVLIDSPTASAPLTAVNQPSSTWKIIGSAQRRHRGAVLQHGSLLLNRSPAAPELPGLHDVTGLSVSPDQVATAVCAGLSDTIGIQLLEQNFPPELESKAAVLANNKYGSSAWTKRR